MDDRGALPDGAGRNQHVVSDGDLHVEFEGARVVELQHLDQFRVGEGRRPSEELRRFVLVRIAILKGRSHVFLQGQGSGLGSARCRTRDGYLMARRLSNLLLVAHSTPTSARSSADRSGDVE